MIDFARIAASLDGFRLVPQWLPDGFRRGNEWVARNPNRADNRPGSFSVNMRSGAWADFAVGGEAEGGDLIGLYAYLFHANDNGAAARELAQQQGLDLPQPSRIADPAQPRPEPPREDKPEPIMPVPEGTPAPDFTHPSHGEPSAVWPYRDRDGRLLFYVCRFDPPNDRKQICPLSFCRVPGKADAWRFRGITGKDDRPLYGLDRLAAMPDAPVLIVEGEKSADAAQRLVGDAFACVAWLGGTSTAEHVNVRPLRGRRVVLWPDFDRQREKLSRDEQAAGVDPASKPILPFVDQPGPRAMITLAQRMTGLATDVRLVGYDPAADRFPSGWDLADAEAMGWGAQNVEGFVAVHAAEWKLTAARNGDVGQDPADDPEADPDPADDPIVDTITVAANDNRRHLQFGDRVNAFGFPFTSDKGVILSCVENIAHLLAEYGIAAAYNVISKEVEISIPGMAFRLDNRANNALAALTSLCSRNRVPVGNLAEFVTLIAEANPRNAAADWIRSRAWDGVDRLPALARTLDPVDLDLALMLLRRWLIGAAACAVSDNGFAMQGVLVLQGPQGAGKTTWLRRLFGNDLSLFREGVQLNPADKDSVKGAISYWGVELGELDATFRKADIAALKAFVTRDRDEVRLPYMRTSSTFPRRTAFCASVNERAYLRDDSGNRRFWTIAVGPAPGGLHDVDVQQVWAQALALFEAGEPHNLARDEMDRLNAANETFAEISPIEELLLSRFRWQDANRPLRMTATEALLAIGYDRPTRQQTTECGRILRKLCMGEPRKSNGREVYALPPKYDDRSF